MPNLPRLSGADTIRALERLGFRQVRQRGSHVVLRRGDAVTVVPQHRRDLAIGTLLGIKRSRACSLRSAWWS
ncbi:MAG TPA: type II toxin-antitoxin system HicA family toxin [Chloroflexota bacterium]|nr:type II toxin-antitoxin system HicA family toxin [Chloroflexota bacterium]